MLVYISSVLAGGTTTFLVNSLLAMFIIGPFFNQALGIVRTMEQGLNWPAMVGGYLILAIILAFLYPRLDFGPDNFLLRGLALGLLLGIAVFACGHLIIAGWSTIPAAPMLWSGLIDATAVMMGGMATALVYHFLGGVHGPA